VATMNCTCAMAHGFYHDNTCLVCRRAVTPQQKTAVLMRDVQRQGRRDLHEFFARRGKQVAA
jgi:hypothetical protein